MLRQSLYELLTYVSQQPRLSLTDDIRAEVERRHTNYSVLLRLLVPGGNAALTLRREAIPI